MSPRGTALLFVVVAAVAAFVFFYEVRGADQRAEQEEAGKRLFPGFEADDVDWIALRTSDGRDARLDREGGVWRLTEPFAFPADDAAASGLATALVGLLREAAFDDPAPLAEYGLEGEPRVRFGVAGEEHALRLGDRSPVGANTYAATQAEAPVYAVASYRTTAFDKALDDLREKRILHLERDRVRALRVAWPEASVRIERDVGDGPPGPWRVVAPARDAADERTVDRLISDLEFLRATAFRAEGEPQGMDPPAFVAELEIAAAEGGDAGEETLRVAIGDSVVDDRRDVEGPLAGAGYQIAAGRLDELPRRVDAYRDRTLASFVASDAARVELAFHAEGDAESHVVTATRGDAGWESEPEALDPEKVATLVAELASLDAESVAAESAGQGERAGLGLEPPRVALRVFGTPGEEGGEGAQLAEVLLGVSDPEHGIAARRPDRETLYWLSPDAAEFLPVSLEGLRSRFLAPEEADAGGGDAEVPPADETATPEP